MFRDLLTKIINQQYLRSSSKNDDDYQISNLND